MSEGNLYVYGIVGATDLDKETSGVNGSKRVYTITHEDVSAVVSEVDTIDSGRKMFTQHSRGSRRRAQGRSEGA
ncbi:GvpL/GvpF family gas vesicle protein [Halomarina rubra]|uniref:GvpL/GvpF family gas vesicle protein n=1 Tax=Halomarina rubra TaxID=2071873 RepID=A0ABD6ARM2_9EURY